MANIKASALTMGEGWLSRILCGLKTMEVRKFPTKHRGKTPLIKSGAAQVCGIVERLGRFLEHLEELQSHECCL